MLRKAALIPAVLALVAAPLTRAQAQTPPIWDASFGSTILTGDDGATNFTLPFAFPFEGSTFTGGSISDNGFLRFTNVNNGECCSADVNTFLNDPASIRPAWFDLITIASGSSLKQNDFADHTTFTWDGYSEFFQNGSNYTFQAQLYANGTIVFGYQSLADSAGAPGPDSHTALTGISKGGGVANPGASDLDSGTPFNTSTDGTVYETFSPSARFDLSGKNVVFTPLGNGAYTVSSAFLTPAAVPEPGVLALLIGFAAPAAGLVMRRRRGA